MYVHAAYISKPNLIEQNNVHHNLRLHNYFHFKRVAIAILIRVSYNKTNCNYILSR